MAPACMLAFIVSVSSVSSATALHVITTEDFINAASAALAIDDSEASQLSNATEQQKLHDYNSMWDGVDSFNSVAENSSKRNATSSMIASARLRMPAMQMHLSRGIKAHFGRTEVSRDKMGPETSVPGSVGNMSAATASALKLDNFSWSAKSNSSVKAISVISSPLVNNAWMSNLKNPSDNVSTKIFRAESLTSSSSAKVGSAPRSDLVNNKRTSKLTISSGNATIKVSRAQSEFNEAFARNHLAPQTGQTFSDATTASAPDRASISHSWALKLRNSSGNATVKAFHAMGQKSKASAKMKLAPQTSRRSFSDAKTASLSDRNSIDRTWALKLGSPAAKAIPMALHIEGNTTSQDHLAPQTGHMIAKGDASAKSQPLARLGKHDVEAHSHNSTLALKHAGVQSMTPFDRTGVNSLVGSMAAAIKDSAFELKHEQAGAKHEQAEARRDLVEAKREHAEAMREQEDAMREQLEAKHELVRAHRTADAAFSAGAISSSQAVFHSKLRPRGQQQKQQHHDDDLEPAPEGSRLLPSPEPETVLGMPIRDGKRDITKPSALRRESRSPTGRRGIAWKMFGSQEWHPSTTSGETSTTSLRAAKRSASAPRAGRETVVPSSEDILNAELAMTFGELGTHAPEHSSLETNRPTSVWSRVDALAKALGDAAAPAPQR